MGGPGGSNFNWGLGGPSDPMGKKGGNKALLIYPPPYYSGECPNPSPVRGNNPNIRTRMAPNLVFSQFLSKTNAKHVSRNKAKKFDKKILIVKKCIT